MNEILTDKTCKEFCALLSSKAAVPGGGGAAALGSSLGLGLANMVMSLTVGKPKFAEYEDELQSMLSEGLCLQKELLALVEGDAEAFAPLSRAYGLPAATDEEKAAKAAALSVASKAAALPPLDIAKKTVRAMELTSRIAEIGTKLALSDAGCASHFLSAALASARYNVVVNLPAITDDVFVSETKDELSALLQKGAELHQKTIALVEGRLFNS